HIAVGRSNVAVERTEVALRDANVRVVDVAVDDVSDDALRMLAGADLVCKLAEERRRRAAIELQGLLAGQAAARPHFVRNPLGHGNKGSAPSNLTRSSWAAYR